MRHGTGERHRMGDAESTTLFLESDPLLAVAHEDQPTVRSTRQDLGERLERDLDARGTGGRCLSSR